MGEKWRAIVNEKSDFRAFTGINPIPLFVINNADAGLFVVEVELIRNLPRETKLIIYGQVLAHTTMAGIDLRPQPA